MEEFSFVLNILLILGFSYFYYHRNRTSTVVNFFWIGLVIKCGFTIFVGNYYVNGDGWQMFKYSTNMNGIYELDSWKAYWNMIFFSEFKSDYWKFGTVYWSQSRAFLMMKIVSLFNIITNRNFWLTSGYLSLFSYFGTFYLLQMIAEHHKKLLNAALICLLFLPSVVFNSSGIVKETVAFGSICVVFGFIIQARSGLNKVSLWVWFGLLVSLFLLLKLKYYYLALLVPACALYGYLNFLKNRNIKVSKVKIMIGVFIFGAVIVICSFMHDALNLYRIVQMIIHNNHISVQNSLPDRYIRFAEGSGLTFLLLNIPRSLLYGFFGPFIWEFGNPAMLYIGIENLIVLAGFLMAFVLSIKDRIKPDILELSWLFYVFGLALILPLASPNFGTLTRYKVSYFPFFCILIFGNINFVNYYLGLLLKPLLKRES